MKNLILKAMPILLMTSSYAMNPTECNLQSQKADSLSMKGKKMEALDLAEKIVKECKPAPYNALMVAAKTTLYQLSNPKKSLEYSKIAIKQGPDFYMGYLNASAAAMTMESYDEAIAFAKSAIEKAKGKDDKLKGRYNLGLAYFKKASTFENSNGESSEIYKQGYEEFKQTKEMGLFKTKSHYFMALYEETILHDEDMARGNYEVACKSGDANSCETLKTLAQRMKPYTKMKNYRPASDYSKLSFDELKGEMGKCYKAKYNMEDGPVKQTVDSIAGSFSTMEESQRKAMMIQTLNSIGCQKK